MIFAIVKIILFIIFTLFLAIGYVKLAETDKLISAFKVREIFEDIAKIG